MGDVAVGSGSEVGAAEILVERAERMALALDPPIEGDLYLVVRVAEQRIALRMTALRSVVPPPPMTELRVDGLVLVGVVALSGEVVPVASLASLLGLEAPSSGGEPMLVVVDDAGSQFAFSVDRVEGHETIQPHLAAHIDLTDSAGAVAPLATPIGDSGLLVLDIDAALADHRLSFSNRPAGEPHR